MEDHSYAQAYAAWQAELREAVRAPERERSVPAAGADRPHRRRWLLGHRPGVVSGSARRRRAAS